MIEFAAYLARFVSSLIGGRIDDPGYTGFVLTARPRTKAFEVDLLTHVPIGLNVRVVEAL